MAALTTKAVRLNLNQRLSAIAQSRWASYVARIGKKGETGTFYQGRADHYSGGDVTETKECTHKHDTDAEAAACAEKLAKR